MPGDRHIRRRLERVVRWEWLWVRNVEIRPARPTCVQGCNQRILIDQSTPGDVDDPTGWLHVLKLITSQHVARVGRQRRREQNPVELPKPTAPLRRATDSTFALNGAPHAGDLNPKGAQPLGYRPADGAVADDECPRAH